MITKLYNINALMMSCANMNTLHDPGKWACCTCWSGVGSNSVLVVLTGFMRDSDICGNLVEDASFRCGLGK